MKMAPKELQEQWWSSPVTQEPVIKKQNGS